MKYFQMIDKSAPVGRWYFDKLSDSTGTVLDAREFCYGKQIEMSPEMRIFSDDDELVRVHFPLRVSFEKRGIPLDFTFGPFGMPVVSMDLADLLLSLDPDSVQVFPVSIEATADDYCIINVTARPRCIDQKRSELVWFTEADGDPGLLGRPKAIYKLVIDRNLVQGRHIFRVEGWEVALIASEVVKKAFGRAHVTGVEFLEV